MENTSGAKTILICEDDETLRELMRVALGDGYRIVEATDGYEAVERAKTEQPDLVVLDLMLPGRNGFDVLADLRAARATHRTPVIVVTAWSHDRDAVIEAGADRFVDKPFVPDDLKATVDSLLGRG